MKRNIISRFFAVALICILHIGAVPSQQGIPVLGNDSFRLQSIGIPMYYSFSPTHTLVAYANNGANQARIEGRPVCGSTVDNDGPIWVYEDTSEVAFHSGSTPTTNAHHHWNGIARVVATEKISSCYIFLSFSVSHVGYWPMWYGGFWHNPEGTQAKVAYFTYENGRVVIKTVDYQEGEGITQSPWMTGRPLDTVVSSGNQQIASGLTIVSGYFFGMVGIPEGYRTHIYIPGDAIDSVNNCARPRFTASVLFLPDGGVPQSGVGFVKTAKNHPGFSGFVAGPSNPPFSCAGPIIKAGTNDIILPPACGVDGRVRYGNFTPSGSLKQFSDPDDMTNLARYEKNNRSFIFQYAGKRKEGSSVMFVATDGVTSPLTITVPGLTVEEGILTFAEIFVVRTDTGEIATIAPAQSGDTTFVIAPEVVSEVAENGGKLVVRAVASADRDAKQMEWPIGGRGKHQECIYEARNPAFPGVLPGAPATRGQVLWMPVAHVVSYGHEAWADREDRCDSEFSLHQDWYYRYISDIAQASVSFAKASAQTIGTSEVAISLVPNLPSTTPTYRPSGSTLRVSTDVPISATARVDVSQLRLFYTITHPVSGTITGVTIPDSVKMMLRICQRDGVRLGQCPGQPFTTSISPPTQRVLNLYWPTTVRGRQCYGYDYLRCTAQRRGIVSDTITGDVQYELYATIALTIGSELLIVPLKATTPLQDLRWSVYYREESR